MKRGSEPSLIEALWYGDFPEDDDEEAENAAAASMLEMTAKVLGLRSFPAHAQRILRAARDKRSDLKKLARLIEGDPAFAARTLQVVNSAAMASRVACKSIPQAVLRVGTHTVGEIAVAAGTMEIFDDADEVALGLRAHAVVVAAVARHLAVKLGLAADDIYTCGLLHDIGKLLLLQYGDDAGYAELLGGPEQRPADGLHVAERDRFKYDHAVLGGHVLQAWNIPEPIPTVVAWHHDFGRALDADPEIGRSVALVRLADWLVHILTGDGTDQSGGRAGSSEQLPALAVSAEAELLELDRRSLARWLVELQTVAKQSLAGDELLADRAEGSLLLRCHACGEPAVPCTECLVTFCAAHGDTAGQICEICANAAAEEAEQAEQAEDAEEAEQAEQAEAVTGPVEGIPIKLRSAMSTRWFPIVLAVLMAGLGAGVVYFLLEVLP